MHAPTLPNRKLNLPVPAVTHATQQRGTFSNPAKQCLTVIAVCKSGPSTVDFT
jgi:hypothetical protein